jgi:hypothetical protein
MTPEFISEDLNPSGRLYPFFRRSAPGYLSPLGANPRKPYFFISLTCSLMAIFKALWESFFIF